LFGFVGSASGADVFTSDNITISDMTITTARNLSVGILVGTNLSNNTSSITNFKSLNSTVSIAGPTGGVVGENLGNLWIGSSSASGLTLQGTNSVGGLLGYSAGQITVSSSTFRGAISGNESIGGLVGYISETATSASFTACGTESGTTISAGSFVGGFLGWSLAESTSIVSCVNRAAITASGSYIGGLVGGFQNVFNIQTSSNLGTVSGVNVVGGLLGSSRFGSSVAGTISGSSNSGVISGNSNGSGVLGLGGIVGYHTAIYASDAPTLTIEATRNTGTVQDSNTNNTRRVGMGGIVG
jgi:hypothetical protein